jgi:hypothetical protein
MISVKHKGDFSKTLRYLGKVSKAVKDIDLDRFGKAGVAALASATPIESGLTANSWTYEITRGSGSITISFMNTNINNDVPIAIILQYGHGTGTGGWVEGRDYINPAIQPIFDEIVENAWREVTRI